LRDIDLFSETPTRPGDVEPPPRAGRDLTTDGFLGDVAERFVTMSSRRLGGRHGRRATAARR
jgi:hypothetical protein